MQAHIYKNNVDDSTVDIFQTVHISKGDQFAVFQTKLPANVNAAPTQQMVDYEMVRRETRLFN